MYDCKVGKMNKSTDIFYISHSKNNRPRKPVLLQAAVGQKCIQFKGGKVRPQSLILRDGIFFSLFFTDFWNLTGTKRMFAFLQDMVRDHGILSGIRHIDDAGGEGTKAIKRKNDEGSTADSLPGCRRL